MLLDRIRNTGIALICVAFSLAAWKSFAGRAANPGGAAPPVASVTAAGRGELTIPVEIVESGEEPRLHQVRVTR
jgi:hypothetical protein